MDAPRQTLSKQERLSGKTAISALMSGGKWGHLGHFRYCVVPNEAGFCRIMISVPKKFFKRAVKRNLLKRRIRESYRTGKQMLDGKSFDILFLYSSTEVLGTDEIREEIRSIISGLC